MLLRAEVRIGISAISLDGDLKPLGRRLTGFVPETADIAARVSLVVDHAHSMTDPSGTSNGLPEGVTVDDLRHTGNHLASMSGASTRELMRRTGHSTIGAALIDQHAINEQETADRPNEVVERETKSGMWAHRMTRTEPPGCRSLSTRRAHHPESGLCTTKAPSLSSLWLGASRVLSG
jgi:hypothetical protein